MKKVIIYIICLSFVNVVLSQTDTIKDIKDNKLEKDYELSWHNYQIGDYKAAKNIILPYYKKGDAPKDVYQLLGNIYDEMGDKTKAASIYDEGLSKYSKAGCLFLEKGNLEFKDGRYPQALYWYEKGIEAEPMFASNYYMAAQVFFLSTETVWGIMYGEIFMLLEQNTNRCTNMSKELFDAYFNSITLQKGKAICDFNNSMIVYSNSFERPNMFPKTFNNLMTEVCKNKSFINIASLTQIRQKFLTLINSRAKDMNNPLFDYHRQLIQSNNFEAYNYWLFAYGNSSEASTWLKQNKNKLNNLQKYLKQHPITLTNNNFFSRYLME